MTHAAAYFLLLASGLNLILCGLMACSFVISMVYYIPFRRIDYKKCYANAW